MSVLLCTASLSLSVSLSVCQTTLYTYVSSTCQVGFVWKHFSIVFSILSSNALSLFSLSLSLSRTYFLIPTSRHILTHTLEYNPLSHTQTSFSLFLILSSSSTVTHTLSYNPLSLSHPNTHTHKHLSLSLSNLHPPSCQNKSDYCGAFWNVGGCFSEIKPNLFTFKQCE